jgi:hypothetical protein
MSKSSKSLRLLSDIAQDRNIQIVVRFFIEHLHLLKNEEGYMAIDGGIAMALETPDSTVKPSSMLFYAQSLENYFRFSALGLIWSSAAQRKFPFSNRIPHFPSRLCSLTKLSVAMTSTTPRMEN